MPISHFLRRGRSSNRFGPGHHPPLERAAHNHRQTVSRFTIGYCDTSHQPGPQCPAFRIWTARGSPSVPDARSHSATSALRLPRLPARGHR